jgi:hypothetical protein
MFIYTGVAKLVNLGAWRRAMAAYSFGSSGPTYAMSLIIPCTELIVAAVIVVPAAMRYAGGAAAVLGLAFFAAGVRGAQLGHGAKCNCTGRTTATSTAVTLARAGSVVASGLIVFLVNERFGSVLLAVVVWGVGSSLALVAAWRAARTRAEAASARSRAESERRRLLGLLGGSESPVSV